MEQGSNQEMRPESRVRFSLRSMLIGMAVVAVGAALLAPWFQQWNGQQRKAFLLFWANLGGGAAVTVVIGCIMQVQTERRAGRTHFQLPFSTSAFGYLGAIAVALVLLGGVLLYSFHVAESTTQDATQTTVDFNLIRFGIFLGWGGLAIWWKAACLELCEACVVNALQFAPWQAVRGLRWGSSNPNLLLLQYERAIVTAKINPADRPAIEQFLASRLAANTKSREAKLTV